MHKTVILLPLDNRPCSYKYFRLICQTFDIPFSIFFSFDDLRRISRKENYYIISLDNILFGGIVNSRRLEFLVKKSNRTIMEDFLDFIENNQKSYFCIYVSVPRLLLNYVQEIDKILSINNYFYHIFRPHQEDLLNAYERCSHFSSSEENYIFNVRKEKLKIIDYFLSQVCSKKIKNIIDFLVVIDDSQFKGLNFLEASFLKKKYSKKIRNFYLMIGLDEIHLLILSKLISREANIYFSSNTELSFKRPRYEGITVKELLKYYRKYLMIDFYRVENSVYHWKIFESKRQEESVNQLEGFNSFDKFIKHFEAIPIYPIDSNTQFFVDLSYANGASLEVLKFLLTNKEILLNLKSFWSWNTFANSLGSSLSHFLIHRSINKFDREINTKLVLENFLESIYQSIIRYFAKKFSWTNSEIQKAFKIILDHFEIRDFDIIKIDLPWERYFEIDVEIRLK